MIQNNRRNQKKQSGITLVALVVTVVILIILTTITINVVFDDGGLIDIVKGAKNDAEDLVQSEDKKMNDLLQEYANIMGEDVEIPEPEPEVDKTPPMVTVTSGETTTNSITVNVQAIDNESGMTENPTYTYYIKKSSEADSSYQIKATDVTNSSYTFTGLQQETSYDIKVEVDGDKAGNKGTGTLTGQITKKVPGGDTGVEEGAITFGNTTWSGGKASITVSTNTGMRIQYQVDSTSGSWTNISNGGTVGSLQHGQTVYARLTDGTNNGDYASASIVDGTPPTVSSITTGTITSNSIQVTVNASDGQSGLATSNTYKYYLNGALKDTLTTASYTFTGLTSQTTYTIKVEAYDKAGLKGEKSITATTNKLTVADAIDGGTQFEDTTKIEDDSGDEVWIPGGFEITDDSATDADDGIVIQDSKGNQFVWIPVPDYTTMYGTGTYTLCGVTTKTSVYSKLRVRSGDSYTVTTPGSTSGIREPELITEYDLNSTCYSILAGSAKAMADNMVTEYTATYNSIKKYKGFYIGRYELTGSVTSPTVKRGLSVQCNSWYNLKKACTNVVSSSYAQSEMVYGNQWDEIMSWLVSSGGKTSSEVNTDSSSWGNYRNSTGAATTNSGSKQTSGKNEAWKANNIYDLAGNCRELTQEASSTYYRQGRGR